MGKRFSFLALIAALALLASVGLAQTPDNSKPSTNNVPNAQYPRVSPDGRITFRVKAPDAQKVAIWPFNGNQGDIGFNGLGHDAYPMTKDSDGNWTVTTPPIIPGFHYYLIQIDGVSVNDPGSETFFGAGRELSGVEVPEPGVDFYLPKEVPHGEIRIFWYHSAVGNSWQKVFLYLPPGYDAHSDQRYPVLYLRHGGGENETGWVNQGHVNFIMDNLIAAGQAKPMIIAMGSGNVGMPNMPPPPPPAAGAAPPPRPNMQRFMGPTLKAADELVSLIDANFRTIPDREHRAIAGLSMGAAQALGIGMANLDKFSAIAAFSRPPMQDFDVKTAFGGVMADSAAFNPKLHVFFVGTGTAETGIFNSMKETRAALDAAGIKYTYVEYPGLAHEWQIWRKQLNDFAPKLFQW